LFFNKELWKFKSCLLDSIIVANGTACGSLYQCATGFCRCIPDVNGNCASSVCATPFTIPINATCYEDEDCVVGAFCISNSATSKICTAPLSKKSGDSCYGGTQDISCGVGLICTAGICTSATTCTSNNQCQIDQTCSGCSGSSLVCTDNTTGLNWVSIENSFQSCYQLHMLPAIVAGTWLAVCDNNVYATAACISTYRDYICCIGCEFPNKVFFPHSVPTGDISGQWNCATGGTPAIYFANTTDICSPINVNGFLSCPVPATPTLSIGSSITFNFILVLMVALVFLF